MSIKEPRSSQVFWQLTALLFWSFQFTLIFPISRQNLFDICNFSSPRWHEFCTVLWGDTTVCSNRGLGVKRHLVPKYKYGCEKFSCLNYNIIVVINLEDILWNIFPQEHLRCAVLCLLQQGAEAMSRRFWGGGAAFPPRQVREENTLLTLRVTIAFRHTKVPKPTKVVLEYLQSGYLVKTGCSTRDVRVKR